MNALRLKKGVGGELVVVREDRELITSHCSNLGKKEENLHQHEQKRGPENGNWTQLSDGQDRDERKQQLDTRGGRASFRGRKA
jgi:hypothetical protein